ncbi:MAG: LolA-related protein [Rhodanobacter sp.]
MLLLALTLPPWASASASDAAPAPVSSTALALIATLGAPAPARTAFAEARFMKVLDRPLVVSGELAWLGGDKLERRVDRPQQETSTIADGEVTQQRAGKSARHFSLKRAPQLQVLLDSFVALLSGDATRLGQAFDVRLTGDVATAWTLSLVPRDAKVASSIGSIAVDGVGRTSRCMRMQEADGDLSIDLLGPLSAKMPAQPTREALLALCQGTR